MANDASLENRGAERRSRWPTAAAVLVAIVGVLLLAGGVWLATLGGSLYYAIAGAALIACAALFYLRRASALWLYAIVLVITMIWALFEVGFDFWRLAPRGDILVPLGIVLVLPFVVRPLDAQRRWLAPAVPLLGALGIAVAIAALSAFMDTHRIDGKLSGPRFAPTNLAALNGGDWPVYGGTTHGLKWSPLDQLTPANAGDLREVWRFDTGDVKGPNDPDEFTYEVTPIKVGGLVYLCSPHNVVFALDAESGKQVWKFDPHVRGSKDMQHLTCRGVSYFDTAVAGATASATGECAQRIVTGTNDARLIELDARTGKPCAGFGTNGQVEVWPGDPRQPRGWWQITSAPLVADGLIVFGGAVYDNKSTFVPSGVIRAYDALTGAPVWAFDPGKPSDTSPRGTQGRFVPSTPNNWMMPSADEALGLVYVPMGMGAVDQWGGNRTPETERFGASIVALDLRTGALRWTFQTVHHDLWDMDVPAQPALIDLELPGRGTVLALVQSTKTGNIFVLDRRTGQPLLPVDERAVPQGAAPGDWAAPTQPFSAASFMPGRIDGAEMWGATTFDQLFCRIKFAQLHYEGPFTPPSTRDTLVFPGNLGVMDWGAMAIDPERQIAFAHPNYMGFIDRLIPQGEAGSGRDDRQGGEDDKLSPSNVAGYNPNTGAPFAAALNPFLSPLGLPCQAPPWGYVAGMDLVTGKVVWKHRNGTIRDESPIPVPFELGVPSLGGPLTTRGGVAFLGSALDYYLRAYDTETGEELWKARLPAGGQASPMSYWSAKSGRQFVVIAAGGHGSLGTKRGDSIVAFALPKRPG